MATDNLPTHAHERLREMRGQDGKPALFTSDLSVNEFLLVKEAGFEPLGLVMGCSVYHIGFQQANWSKNEEMTVLTQAMYHARELAMERMQHEAQALQAEGIVGVQIVERSYQWSSHVIEFFTVGTAVVPMRADHHIPKPQLVLSLDD